MSLVKFIRSHSRLIDVVMSISEREERLTQIQATLDGENGWMKRLKSDYCEKCEDICSEKENNHVT